MRVSIPNGMEFYLTAISFFIKPVSRFNSQRDGILLNSAALTAGLAIVSIPNGMEFYSINEAMKALERRFNSQRDGILRASNRRKRWTVWFQFPTGWNSTLTGSKTAQETASFNSQRDGILRRRWGMRYRRQNVSIPNGMEFYAAGLVFHSRILHVSIPNGMEFYLAFYSPFNPLKKLFQFPTGWNSTVLEHLNFPFVERVSIPNGMEFYLQLAFLNPGCMGGFNSQRDGILPVFILYPHKQNRQFQFPTGWNSTVGGEAIRTSKEMFQFPTGWNSTGSGESEFVLYRAFQFPTGWNSTKNSALWKYYERRFNSQRDGILLRASFLIAVGS